MDNQIILEKITETKIKNTKSITELNEMDQVLRSRIENGNKYWLTFMVSFLILCLGGTIFFLGVMGSMFFKLQTHIDYIGLGLYILVESVLTIYGFIVVRNTIKLSLKDNKLLSKRLKLRKLIKERTNSIQNNINLELNSLSITTKKFLKEKGVIING
jgi:hypothetical protein